MADFVLGYYALPDLPTNTRVKWLKPEEKTLALKRMADAGKGKDVSFTWTGIKRILFKWHFWVYTAYYTYVHEILPDIKYADCLLGSLSAARISEPT
jgi:hypothetical protein